MYCFKLFNSMQRSLGTYSRRMVAKSGKSENGQMQVNSAISKLILISLPGNSYGKVSSGYSSISARGVDWMSRPCWFGGDKSGFDADILFFEPNHFIRGAGNGK